MSALVILPDYILFYGHLFFRYPRYSVRGYQLATNIVTKHPRLGKGAVINGSGAVRVVTVAASAYNSKRAVRWLNASVRNKAPTMQSSLTSSSRVNRASRGRGRGEISGPGRRRTSRVFTRAVDRWPNSRRWRTDPRMRTKSYLARSSWDWCTVDFALRFFLFFILFFYIIHNIHEDPLFRFKQTNAKKREARNSRSESTLQDLYK